jgi:hypothetical protein
MGAQGVFRPGPAQVLDPFALFQTFIMLEKGAICMSVFPPPIKLRKSGGLRRPGIDAVDGQRVQLLVS